MSDSRDNQTVSSVPEGAAPKDGASRRNVLLASSALVAGAAVSSVLAGAAVLQQ